MSSKQHLTELVDKLNTPPDTRPTAPEYTLDDIVEEIAGYSNRPLPANAEEGFAWQQELIAKLPSWSSFETLINQTLTDHEDLYQMLKRLLLEHYGKTTFIVEDESGDDTWFEAFTLFNQIRTRRPQ